MKQYPFIFFTHLLSCTTSFLIYFILHERYTGNEVTRTCDLYGINDCQTANGIKYCYCNANRCNGKAATATIDDDDNTEKSHPIDHRRNPILREADDEDYADDDGDDDIEASGFNEAIDDALPIELTTITTTTTSTHATQTTTTTMKTTSNKSTIPMSAASPPPPSQSSPHSRINHTATGTTISTTSTRTVANTTTDNNNTTSIGDNILTTANPTLDVRSSASNVTIKIVISSLSSMLIFWRALA